MPDELKSPGGGSGPGLPKDLLPELLRLSIILPEEVSAEAQRELSDEADPEKLLETLAQRRLLTSFQISRLRRGRLKELVLGNYRLLHHLGTGGMGAVFEAEHIQLRQPVAIKILSIPPVGDYGPLLGRFLAEMRSVAQLQHPNIVTAKDAGCIIPDDPDALILHYFVMEFVPGLDLEAYVEQHGPMSVDQACDVIYQIAGALGEAHQHQLIHRDVKPSNILVTPEGQAKLLDFGLARQSFQRLTEPGAILGTVDYMAPEQARDSSAVDGRADLFGLGGTLFWCLTGNTPFPRLSSNLQSLVVRLKQDAPSVRLVRPDIPPELDQVIVHMMANEREDRYPSAQALMRALLPFLRSPQTHLPPMPSRTALESRRPFAILLVDDEANVRGLSRMILEAEGLACDEAADGVLALEAVKTKRYDLMLVDVDMPRLSGLQVLQQLRALPPWPHLKILMVSGRASVDEMAQMMLDGADDYLTKPFSVTQLKARIKTALNLKEAQDRSDILAGHMLTLNTNLELTLTARDSDLLQMRDALVLALAKLVECRTAETAAHLLRVQNYCRCLAETSVARGLHVAQLASSFIQLMVCCAPLHDIGKVGLPDHILGKPGKYEADERVIMQMHTVMGADTLQKVARRYGTAVAFLQMAIDIARHHHERYDGSGYPDRLAGEQIPLAARILAVADVYDAMRTRQTYRPAIPHHLACDLILKESPGHFDPLLLDAFRHCANRFDIIYKDLPDGTDF